MGTLQGQTYSQRMNITLVMLVPEKITKENGLNTAYCAHLHLTK